MIFQRRRRLYLLWVATSSALVVQCAAVLKVASNCGNVQILSNELTAQEAEDYCRYAVSERRKVETFWGSTWKERIQIHVASSYRAAGSLVANQGQPGWIQMPLSRVNSGALLHEIVHNYAPNNNRFFQEGLAVYLQDKIGGNPAFPIFGENLHVLARDGLSTVTSLRSLNSVRFPRRLGTVMHERTAYILAGSFVGFLIEKYGLPKFKNLYETESYDRVYGKSLEILEREWRSSIQEKIKAQRS